MELPNPAPKTCEQEKLKAMVDSVIEFITASRNMLCALNQRLKDSARAKEESKKRTEDENAKPAIYQDCLNSEKKSIELISQTKTDQILPIPFPAAKQSGQTRPPQPEKECQKTPDKSSTEIQAYRTLDPPSEGSQTNPPAQCLKHPKVKCKKIAAEEAVLSHAGVKTPMPSRIPRAKSMIEEKMGSGIFDKAPTEGGAVKSQCAKRTPKEASYSSLRQRSKTPKGDGSTVL
ncbi:uncharacterized protein LOC125502327 [Dendroctonus ponderosae]|nr:uncharacterized protein LOC125502327 [Dendroctonus ponderosae]